MQFPAPFLFGFLLLSLAACTPDTPAAGEVQTLDPKTVRLNTIVHDSLSADQLAAIARIQTTFAEVYPVGLEETITDFKRDQHPDREIIVWQTMAGAYEKYLASSPKPLSLAARKEAFSLLLMRSMMPSSEVLTQVKHQTLSAAQAAQVLALYDGAPAPLVVTPVQ